MKKTSFSRFPDIKRRNIVGNRVTMYRKIKAGLLPQPIRLGPNSIAFDDDELEAALAAWREARDLGITDMAEVAALVAKHLEALRAATPQDQAA